MLRRRRAGCSQTRRRGAVAERRGCGAWRLGQRVAPLAPLAPLAAAAAGAAHILATSITASRQLISLSFSRSSSVLACCRPLPSAVAKKRCARARRQGG